MKNITIFSEVAPFPSHKNKMNEAHKAVHGETVDVSKEAVLVDVIQNFAYSCSVFNGSRANKNFKHADFIALDIDQDQTIRGVCKVLDRLNLEAYIGTTTSHQKDKNGQTCDRFRVILPLEERISDINKFQATLLYLLEYFKYDTQCKDPARFYFACNKVAKVEGMPLRTINIKAKKKAKKKLSKPIEGKKGMISKRTKEFLENGPASGNWHEEFLYACRDMKSQQYSEGEIAKMFEENGWKLDSDHDVPQLKYVMRDNSVEFEYRSKDD